MADNQDKPAARAKKTPAKKAAAAAATPPTPKLTSSRVAEDLRMGTRDSDIVRALQGVLGIEATGDYDATTMAAVRDWQSTHGFAGGRGIKVGDAQARQLFGDLYKP